MLWGRVYFAAQAAGGALWWVAVALVPAVRVATLGSLDPVLLAVLDIPLFVIASAVAAWGVRWAAWISAVWTVLVAVALAVYATVAEEAGWGVVIMVAAAVGSLLALGLVVMGRVPTRWIISGPFAFHLARVRVNPGGHLPATFVQLTVMWVTFLVAGPLVLLFLERRWQLGFAFPSFAAVVGVVVLVLASLFGIWSAVAMSIAGNGTPLPAAMPNRLVIVGPYRYVRNPMALASILQGVAVGLILSSWLVIVYALLGAILWNYAVRPHEEADLEERFGTEFARYRDAVWCWVPKF